MSAITENGRNSQNVPFETELQLSDGNIILCIKIWGNLGDFDAQIPTYFVLLDCIYSDLNSQNVPFETELQLSDGNIILCIKIWGNLGDFDAQIPPYFVLQDCIY